MLAMRLCAKQRVSGLAKRTADARLKHDLLQKRDVHFIFRDRRLQPCAIVTAIQTVGNVLLQHFWLIQVWVAKIHNAAKTLFDEFARCGLLGRLAAHSTPTKVCIYKVGIARPTTLFLSSQQKQRNTIHWFNRKH